ncbi:hypothetical protein BV898_07189 [Hypsibius exemplaris]|uniref:Platelet-derived growth factor (PDGF) family profile domain-containing protein n=1 Tax=Hypsibius exemplaris TaxID=2072580 RepID=A0A1W0WU76_HYPEX|nr:hypothetical protein BV898_07189 [Hypsibius exemplaris]
MYCRPSPPPMTVVRAINHDTYPAGVRSKLPSRPCETFRLGLRRSSVASSSLTTCLHLPGHVRSVTRHDLLGFRLRHFFSNDHLLRDLSPQDEVFDAEFNNGHDLNFYEIPAQALLEVSQLTDEKLTQEDLPLTTGQDMPLEVVLPVDQFVPMESHHPKEPKIAPLEMASNFRMAKMLEEPAVEPPVAENARCLPRDTVVPMPKPKNITLVMWPECTVVKQCGGCCGNNNLQCKPTRSSTINRKGMHLGYVNGRLQIVEQTVVSLTEHTECACQCRQNASDCNTLQRYEPGNCRCVCLNQDMANNCGPNRVWDAERCECKCPNAGGTCPVGFHFDHNHYCSCISNNTFRQSKVSRVKKAQQPSFTPAVAIYQNSLARRSRSDRG